MRAVEKNGQIQRLTAAVKRGYISRTSPSWASAPGREAAPFGAAFAFSGMLVLAGRHFK